MAKGFTVRVKPKQAHEAKMSPDELHNYLNIKLKTVVLIPANASIKNLIIERKPNGKLIYA